MEGPLVAIKMSFQPVLEHLSDAVMVFSEFLQQSPWIFRFPWVILAWATMIVFMIKRQYNLKKKKELAKRLSAQVEEYHEFIQKIRLITQAYEVFQSRPTETRPLQLNTLCLAVLGEYVNRFASSLEDYLKKDQKCELPKLSYARVMLACLQIQTRLLEESSKSLQFQVSANKNILKESQKNVEQVQREITDGLVKTANLQENLKLLSLAVENGEKEPGKGKDGKDT